MQSILRTALAALGTVMLASATTALAQTPNLTTIRLISAPSDDLRPVLYAQKAGLFQRAGLNVTIELTNSGAVAAQAVISGAMDVGKSSLTPLLAAYAHGLPFVLVAPSILYHPQWPLTGEVVVAANSPIRSPLDLQGKVVACTALGDIGYLGIRALVDNRGGDSSTIKWVEIPTAAVTPALDAGRVDAGLITEPSMSRDIKAGKVRFLFDMLAPGSYPRPILESAFYSTHAFADKNRDAVARFAKVVEQAAAYSNTHEAETVPLWAAFAGLEPDVAAKINHTYTATSFDPQQVQPVIDLAARYNIIPHAFDARDFIAGTIKPANN
jgi:NitT/TauT family transport system substrate-binding protein